MLKINQLQLTPHELKGLVKLQKEHNVTALFALFCVLPLTCVL